MSLNKKINKETISILLRENKRLKRENQKLIDSLDELQRYKDEYKDLIKELHSVKESYIKKMGEFDEIENAYKAELDRLVKKVG